MSYVSNETHYLELMRQLIASEIDGESFCREFSALWRVDRDEEAAKCETWPERYDLKLIKSYREGEIPQAEFENKWVELFGYGEYRQLVEILSSIFTACDVFNPVPKNEYEIDETQLRNEVGTHLTNYQAEKAKRNPYHPL